ncbi:MAG: alpha/beta hydrolase [Rhodospirillaceae bacterium]|jgi:pimeloyl-ACP methyl ester carboxylesterase|nr:alpha/beta hydrolase [Rhodospirillaceae bacterium]MBT5455847.1 alpha/beta hydrolase [Rhodospirillaceae bacterium]
MPYTENDGVRLYFEETGSGFPIVFVHEFADDYQSWEKQVGYFSRRYRCVTFNARGYPPSDVPEDQSLYSQAHAADDIAAIMRGTGIDRAHIVGISMGGFATLHFGLRHGAMAASLTVAACGYGAAPDQREQFAQESEAIAGQYDQFGAAHVAASYAVGAYRAQFMEKDPVGWRAFKDRLAAHSSRGASLTMRGVQKQRPSLYDLEEDLSAMTVPTLIINGDEDDWCLEPGLFLKRVLPAAGLWVVPKTGHTINLEEPGLFNNALSDFFAMVEAGKWTERQGAVGASALMSGPES